MQTSEFYQIGEHSWSLPENTRSKPRGRSLHDSFNATQSATHQQYRKLPQIRILIPQHGETPRTDEPTELPLESQARLQYAVRRLTICRKLSDTRLAVATPVSNPATRRKYNRINYQCEKTPDNHISPEKAERAQSDLKIVAMPNPDTVSALSTYGQSLLRQSHQYISTKQGRYTNDRPEFQRANQIQGTIPRKIRGYLQVLRAYLQSYLQVPTGTYTEIPAGGAQFSDIITNNYAAPEAAETYIMALSDPCRTRKRTENKHLPRMRAPEANQHTSSNIKWTWIYPLSEPCPQPRRRRRRAPIATKPSHTNIRCRLHTETEHPSGNEPCQART